MEKMLPEEYAEPAVRGSASARSLRTGTYLVLALVVTGAAWLRFNSQIAAVMPGLAASSGVLSAEAVVPAGLVDLAILPSGEARAAVAGMGLQGGDAALMLKALREGRLRLVRMPLVDVSTLDHATGGPPAHDVILSTGGYAVTVHLTRAPVSLALPITAVGEVTFRTAGPDPVGIGALSLSGPVRLPDLAPGQVLSVGVVVQ